MEGSSTRKIEEMRLFSVRMASVILQFLQFDASWTRDIQFLRAGRHSGEECSYERARKAGII